MLGLQVGRGNVPENSSAFSKSLEFFILANGEPLKGFKQPCDIPLTVGKGWEGVGRELVRND